VSGSSEVPFLMLTVFEGRENRKTLCLARGERCRLGRRQDNKVLHDASSICLLYDVLGSY
jgi:hypothetical protein